MMQVQIKFTTTGACSAVGGFMPGDTARLPAALAAHLVNEVKCAKYITQPGADAVEPVIALKRTRKPTPPSKE